MPTPKSKLQSLLISSSPLRRAPIGRTVGAGLRCRRTGLALIIETACIIPTMNDEAALIKCDPDPARLSPDDVTMVIAVLRVDN
jgi:hypothetical protein